MNYSAHAAALVNSMSFTQKVGQLNQRLLGWEAVEKKAGKLIATDKLKREIDHWGGLGVLYGLFRADPWSGRSWSNGIEPEERLEAAELVQQTVSSRGAHGIGVLLSEEAPHGHQALGGTILPTNLSLGATFDPQLVERAQASVAAELRSSGVHIALVSGLDIARDPRWGRCEECFGEDPLLAAQMCTATVQGMQGEQQANIGVGRPGVAVVLKHLAAQGEAMGGRNGQSAVVGSRDLRQIHLPPVVAGVEAGVWGFMAAYNDIDGVPCCANSWLLKTYLREQLGFRGAIMADGFAVDRLEEMCGSIPLAGRRALLSGVDVSLWDEGFASLEQFEDDEQVRVAVDAALQKLIDLKETFGLLPAKNTAESALQRPKNQPQNIHISQAQATTRNLGLQLARESLVPLKGEPSILKTVCKKVLLTGPFAADPNCFLGDYTAPLPQRDSASVTSYLKSQRPDMAVTVAPATTQEELAGLDIPSFDAVIAIIGGTSERQYTDAFAANGAALSVGERGATGGEGVDLSDVDLAWGQADFITWLSQRAAVPVTSVVVSGRAHVLTEVLRASGSVIWAGYPGQFGAQAIVDALLGEFDVQGRLPVTAPRSAGVVPVHSNDRQSAQKVYKDEPNPILLPFGYSAAAPTVGSLSIVDARQAWGSSDAILHVEALLEEAHAGPAPLLFMRRQDGIQTARRQEFAALGVMNEAANMVQWSIPRRVLFDEGVSVVKVQFMSGESQSENILLSVDGAGIESVPLHSPVNSQ